MNSSKKITEQTPPPAYFGALTITDVKCFKGEHFIDLSDSNGKPAMWTVILGNNNTGKTTLLKCSAHLEPIKIKLTDEDEKVFVPKGGMGNTFENRECVSSDILYKVNEEKYLKMSEWSYQEGAASLLDDTDDNYFVKNLIIYGYGTNRKMGNSAFVTFGKKLGNQDNTASLFDDNTTLINAEEWLLQTFFAEKLEKPDAARTLKRIKEVLISGILPDVQDFRFDTTPDFKGFVEVKTDYGWVKLRELGYGYQVTLAWVVDLAQKMFIRYKDSKNPLHEPAIVLVDEIDLHLHPEWQRKIISFLKAQFPHTQFIVTTHSPLIVQSAENINLVLLKKEENHVVIEQPKLKTYRGWTVEEILSELMGLDDKTLSDDYLKLMQQFDEALDEDDYKKAKTAYDELDKILHPTSHQRKLLNIQMTPLHRNSND